MTVGSAKSPASPFYIDADQDDRWNEPTFLLVPGESDTCSLENADRVHFVARSSACRVAADN